MHTADHQFATAHLAMASSSLEHAQMDALTLEAVTNAADTGTKHYKNVPVAPRHGGIQAVVTSPRLGSPEAAGSPVRLRDLIMPGRFTRRPARQLSVLSA